MKSKTLASLLATLLLGAGVAALVAGADAPPSPAITPSPAFTPAQLLQSPTANWPTNGGNLYNQRYSPLTQLDRSNVKELKAVWRASLRGSGLDTKNSGQAQILAWEGVLYVVTGMDDVFAISVDTGAVLWEYRANLDPEKVRVCCGWAARGVGMGDGRIYVGQLDNQVVALDQKTGKVVWRTQSQTLDDGPYSITMAPLYYDGMVIIGHSGGDMGIRGMLKAFDAKTGAERWRWYTIPGPGEPGHETWPSYNDSWKYGGGAVWSTPAVDPELGLIYFPVANPGPDLNGAVREGDNLYTSSVVALEAATGKYRWHFQAVHHDIWDYGGSNPVVLFDVMLNGQLRKGISHAPKSAYVYILDRITGKPLVGIEERPVPQLEIQKTAKTQPIPIGDDIVPHSMDAAPEGFVLVNQGRTFTPFDKDPVPYKQLAGINFPPMSYDVENHLLYVCANDSIGVVTRAQSNEAMKPTGRASGWNSGSFGRTNIPRLGVVAALDVTTQKVVWRQQWPDVCYSGSVNTAGGLLFLGRQDGRVMALDKRDGLKLWEWQLDAPLSAPMTTFEYKGEQMLAVYAAGNFYSGSRRGDGVWLLSRKGAMKPSAPLADSPATARGGTAAAVRVDPSGGNAAAGRVVFQRICALCHGENGKGGHSEGAVLPDNIKAVSVMTTATTGKKDMPSFAATLSAQEMKDVAAYVEALLKK
jgi:alcohol dehydrogenase (cytochrome c)